MDILFIVDPLEGLDLQGDTSYALMLEAEQRGHRVWTCQNWHLGLEHDQAVVDAEPTAVTLADTPAEAFARSSREHRALADFGVVFLRTDPPLNVDYLHTTWILDRAVGQTVLVNNPRGLRALNEHLSILRFPDLIPPTLVTRSESQLRKFLEEQGGAIVLKPVDGFGGLGIFLAREGDPNLSSIIESSTQAGRVWTMAQRYLPDAAYGDKRIVLVDGDPIGAVLRVPPDNEVRDNLHVGARAAKTELTPREVEIIERVKPMLRSYEQILVGLDVIGDHLTEINITSPTGIRHISRLDGINAAAPVLACAERKARALQSGP